MRTINHKLKAASAAFLLAIGATVAMLAVASPASAATGSVHIQEWCKHVATSSPADTTAVVLDQHNAYSWRCHDTSLDGTIYAYWNVDMNAACAYWYGNPGTAGLGSSTNPYSWYCIY